MTSATTPEQTKHKLPIRTLIAASVGNAVEWYDWTVYATFSIYFATQIFSAENESLAFIVTFATYALAFFFRPLGGFLLGRYADLKGRKQAMLLTIMLMAGGSLVIAILPTYASRRLARPDPPAGRSHRPGHVARWGGVQRVGVPRRDRTAEPPRPLLVVLLHLHRHRGAARLAARRLARQHLADDQLASWGWRVPFLIGAALGLVGLWMRRDMAETEQFEENNAKAKAIKNPLHD